MPDGRAALEQLGISIPAETGYSFRGIRFVSGELRVDASFPNGMGQGVRRTILHSLMVARAEACGVSLLWRTPGQRFASGGCGDRRPGCAGPLGGGADGGQSLSDSGPGSTATATSGLALRFAGIIEFPRGVTAWSFIGSEMPDLCHSDCARRNLRGADLR